MGDESQAQHGITLRKTFSVYKIELVQIAHNETRGLATTCFELLQVCFV
jgi:hypothetical protein